MGSYPRNDRNPCSSCAVSMLSISSTTLALSPIFAVPSTPETESTTAPVSSVATCGVRNRGWILPRAGGNRPSRDIDSRIRGWPNWKTKSTAVWATIEPKVDLSPAVLAQLPEPDLVIEPGPGGAAHSPVKYLHRRLADAVDAFMEKPLNVPLLVCTVKMLSKEDPRERERRMIRRDFITTHLSAALAE